MTTVTDTIETPVGPSEGQIFAPLQVLGVVARQTSTKNQSDSWRSHFETITIDVPVGTQVIVPCVTKWWLTYGKLTPDVEPDEVTGFQVDDHHWGSGYVNIRVADINAPDFSSSPPTQSATLELNLWLTDHNHDDQWFGEVAYTLICLGSRVDDRGAVGRWEESLAESLIKEEPGRQPKARKLPGGPLSAGKRT